jgi:nitroreductase
MEVHEAVQRRRAFRNIDPRPIEDEKVMALVEAMRLSPSCFNNQPWRVVVCTGETLPKLKESLTKGNAWATPSPLILAICAKPSDDCRQNEGRDYYQFGCGLAVGELMLRATELGLIAHPIGGYEPAKSREALGIPKDYVVITLVICGYPSEDTSRLSDSQKTQQAERPPRKPTGDNFFRDQWGKSIVI